MVIKTLDDLKKQDNASSDEDKATSSYVGGERSGLEVKNPKKAKTLVIKQYNNGLVVNDKFMRIDDPETAQFMEQLRSGEVPEELVSFVASDGTLPVEMQRFESDYKPPAAAQTKANPLFQGQGQSAASQAETQVQVTANVAAPVDPSKPTTRLQIRFPNGQRVAQDFNLDAPVQAIINFASASLQGAAVTVVAGFPPAPVQPQLTIEAAGLANSAVTVKLS